MWNYLAASLLVTLLSLLLRHNLTSPSSVVDRPPVTSYDYIVVGAGTAGCVVASRLSENPNVTVLLVEAGGYFGLLSSVPLAAPGLQRTKHDWAYKTEGQAHSSRGMWDHQQLVPRGKGLGGSGQINYLVHGFGRPGDYEGWPRGWSHEELRPYFEEVAETMRARDLEPEEAPLARALHLAARAMPGDRRQRVVFSKAQITTFEGSRWSTYHSHLQRAWNRPNLNILPNARVTRVLVDEKKVTEGVEVEYEGISESIEVNKEVIVSAGAIGTPQLLLLSGIGPAQELRKHKIPVKLHLTAVGKNYIDHFNMPVFVTLKAPVSITIRKLQTIPTLMDYFLLGTGFLSMNGIMGGARIDDSALLLAAVGSADEKILRDLSNYRSETFRSLFPTHNDTSGEGFIFMSSCQQPKSRGYLTLRSSDPLDSPVIDPAFLEHPRDVACTIKAIRLGLTILETPMFREFGAKVHVPDFEECADLIQDYRNDEFAECVIRTSGITGHHPCGTCKMGDTQTDSVVDPFLRVYGIEGLRVVDASVLPGPISGTPNSVIVALAEKAADIIAVNKT